jgi:hypothetical protein
MSWSSFNPTAWTAGVTIPQVSDYQGIYSDLRARGGVIDGGGYGRANTSYVILIPGELPGTQHSVSSATWAGGVATLTVGGHSIQVNQRVTVSGNSLSGYNTPTDSVAISAVTSTSISFTLASNPGGTGTGGTVLVDGVTPAYGMLAVDQSLNFKIWNGSAWVAATTASNAPVWWVASGAPSSSLGSNGDMYLNSATGDIYGPKAAGAWGSPDVNVKGPTGYSAVWNVGAGVPGSGVGNNGDMYLNSNNGNVYGPKTAGAWGSIDCNITGPGGLAGNTEAVNNQTGTSYTFASTDAGNLITFSNSSAMAATLPQGGTSGIVNKWYVDVQNRGTGTLSITPTSCSIDSGGSGAAISIPSGQGCRIVCDGSNYWTMRGMGGGTSYTVGSVSATTGGTITPSYNRLLVKADASGGAFSLALPSASSYVNFIIQVQKVDSSVNAVTITGGIRGTQTLSGQWNDYEYQSDATSWYTI